MKDLVYDHCDFDEENLNYLVSVAEKIVNDRQYPDNDVFIDVLDSKDKGAYVVFQRPCLTHASLYQNDIVGEIALLQNEPGVLRTLQTGLISNGLHGVSQEGRDIVQVVHPIRGTGGTIATLIIESSPEAKSIKHSPLDSIVDRKNLMQQLAESYNQFDHGVLLYEKDGQLVWANDSADLLYQKLGYQDSLESLHYDNMALDNTTFEYLLYLFTVKKEVSQIDQTSFLNYYFSIKKVWLQDSERILVLIWDITRLKTQEEDIRQKSLLIQEIHHRVKNNLQSVVSLLHLQERRAENDETKKALRESSSRIMAIATTHQLLSQHFDEDVSLKSMVENLLRNLQQMLVSSAEIKVEIDVNERITLDSKQLVTLSLIINELISNAYEHAFENRSRGTITISASRHHRQVELIIKDDGIGYDSEHIKANLGLKIVSMYINEDLQGHLDIESNSTGTINKIQFITGDK